MMQPLLAVDPPNIFIQILAVLGSATACGFGAGWIALAIVKLWLGQTLPRWPVWLIRTLGFIAGGLLGWLLIHPSFGGSLWFGGGKDGDGDKKNNGSVVKKDDTARKDREKEKEKEKPPKKDKDERDKSKVPPAQTLRIEVLGTKAIERITGTSPADKNKVYRVAGTTDLLTLEEVQKLVLKRKDDKPPLLRLVTLIYGDSPDREAGPVRELILWARDLNLEVPAPFDEEGKAPLVAER